jgi:hypothetical protein
MGTRSNAVTEARDGAVADSILDNREARRLAREVHKDLQIVGTRRTNLLLMGTAHAIRVVLEMLWLDQSEPVVWWHPGQPLDLPPAGRIATIVLHDIDELSGDDQYRLLRWLDQTAGRIRVVSTTAVPLWPLVKAGTFNDVLYYQLNTISVDMGV